MNKVNSTTQVILLMVELMKSTGNFVHARIHSEKGKHAYQTGLQEAIETLYEFISRESSNVEMMRDKVKALYDEPEHRFKRRWFSAQAEQERYFIMAVDHAMDVIDSIDSRFIKGGERSPRFEGIGLMYEEKKVF